MGVDSDTVLRFTQVRIDPSATLTLRQHLAPGVGVILGVEGMGLDPESFVPRYSGWNSYLPGLVIVIGPVDCVDNSCRGWWRRGSPVDGPWTGAVDNWTSLCTSASRPQDG